VGVRERREREKEALRQEILDAARDLFIQEGYQNVSMRKIAEKIEYSPTTIYLYFRDKAELLFQICEETFAGLLQTLEAIGEGESDLIASLKQGLRAYVEFGLAHPNHYLLTFVLRHDHADFPDDFAFEDSTGARAFNHLRTMVQKCVDKGALRQTDVEATSQALWAAAHGVTSLLIVHDDFPFVDRDVLIDRVIDISVESLRA
jgi:AcrR family transcriptional regulator